MPRKKTNHTGDREVLWQQAMALIEHRASLDHQIDELLDERRLSDQRLENLRKEFMGELGPALQHELDPGLQPKFECTPRPGQSRVKQAEGKPLRQRKDSIAAEVVEFFRQRPKDKFNAGDVAEALGYGKDKVASTMRWLLKRGSIVRAEKAYYRIALGAGERKL